MKSAFDSARDGVTIGLRAVRFRRNCASGAALESGTLRHDTFCYDKALKLFA
jgi:hypothetical protein